MGKQHAETGEVKLDPEKPQRVIDYSLQRRAVLADLREGRIALDDVCDADRYLLRAAEYHGTVTEDPCPVCRKDNLVLVKWVFPDNPKDDDVTGSARSEAEISELARNSDEFTVHEVEVCRSCRWNHVVRSYVLGWPPGLSAKILAQRALRGQA